MTSNNIKEPTCQFESRKKDHIELALKSDHEAIGYAGLDKISLIHSALPEINFSEVSLRQKVFGTEVPKPFLISSMTAGHQGAKSINRTLAEAATAEGWLMGVGSQRRQLFDDSAHDEWQQIRKDFPKVKLLGNIGVTQLIHTSVEDIKKLLEPIEASALIVHTNPLQEALQPEGTPNFKGSYDRLAELCRELDIPIVLKEVGCGFSKQTLQSLQDIGIYAIDVSGFGGTHWGRIEGARAKDDIRAKASRTFSHWGISTLQSLLNAKETCRQSYFWASGGIRSGLDAAKCLALGAQIVGFAKPMLEGALAGPESLIQCMQQIEFECRLAMFCAGTHHIAAFQECNVWHLNP